MGVQKCTFQVILPDTHRMGPDACSQVVAGSNSRGVFWSRASILRTPFKGTGKSVRMQSVSLHTK
jgi:hypothetical protein